MCPAPTAAARLGTRPVLTPPAWRGFGSLSERVSYVDTHPQPDAPPGGPRRVMGVLFLLLLIMAVTFAGVLAADRLGIPLGVLETGAGP